MQTFEAAKEEQLIFLDRAAQGRAKFIAIKGGKAQAFRKVILCREDTIAVEFEQAPVEEIRAGLSRDQDLCATVAKLCR